MIGDGMSDSGMSGMDSSPADLGLRDLAGVCFDWGDTLMPETLPPGVADDLPMAAWPVVSCFDDVVEAFDLLTGGPGRLPLAIATNASVSTRDDIEQALARVGLARHFSRIFCYRDLGLRKDEAGFWAAVSRDLGLPLGRLAMIGDNLVQDVVWPRRFGVQAVWLDRSGRGNRVAPASARMDGGPWAGSDEGAGPAVDVPTVTRLPAFARAVVAACRPGALPGSLPSPASASASASAPATFPSRPSSP